MVAFAEAGGYGTLSYSLTSDIDVPLLTGGPYARAVYEYRSRGGKNRTRVERRWGGSEVILD